MIDLAILKKRGCDTESLRTLFSKPENRQPTFDRNTANAGDTPAPEKEPKKKKDKDKETDETRKVNKLRNRIRLRIQNGRDWNLSTWRPFHAINRAMDVPLEKAVTPTMLHTLVNRQWTSVKEVGDALSAWGYNLNDVVCEELDAKVDGKPVVKVNLPAFYQIIPPICLAYKTIRQAKIMNDLNRAPFLEYHPAFESATSRLQCDVITNRVERMSTDYAYYNVVEQGVSNMLTYGRGFQFPKEEWHREEQEVEDKESAEQTEEDGVMKPVLDADKNYTRIVKEGIRPDVPPPERVYWDQAHPPYTLNSDTGCEWGGYWSIKRVRDLLDDDAYFNTDKITIGNYAWDGGWNTFFSTIYPCQLAWPKIEPMSNDRETKLMDQVYSTDEGDKTVAVTNHFEKLIPRDYGLGTYRYPVWFRFVVAGDDTIIYAAPLPYAPCIAYLYDHDQNKAKTPSLALEIIPSQDLLGQLLSQLVLTIKRNLDNITFYDKTVVKDDALKKLKNLGNERYTSRNFVPMDLKKLFAQQSKIESAFFSPNFPYMDTNALMQGMRVILDMLERTLQMSAQELGQAASHEQSKGEVNIIAQQTSTRLQYTMTPVVQAREAFKKQIYYGTMAFGEESFWAQIPNDRQVTPQLLDQLGFEYREGEHMAHPNSKHMTVRVKKSSLMLEQFAAVRTNEQDRQRDIETGQMLINMLGQLMKGPLGAGIGVEQGLEFINMAGRLAGWPRDFRLKNMSPQLTPEQQAEQVKQQLAGFIKEIEDTVLGQVKQALTPMLQHQKQLEEAVAHLAQINEHAHPQLAGMPNGMPEGMPNGAPVSPFRY